MSAAAEAHPAPDLRLFDCRALVGLPAQPPPAVARTPQDLLAEMDRCGVDEALVHSDETDMSSAVTTNGAITAFCAASERLHPVWRILPPQTEMPVDELLGKMRHCGVRILSARPVSAHFLLNGLTFGELFEAMIERRVPLFLDRGDTPWPMVIELLRDFPRLILCYVGGGNWGHDRFARPVMRAFDTFYMDTSDYELDGGIKALVEGFGPQRLLFGSGYHRRPMGSASLQLRNLDLADDAKELIAHGNLERLLREVKQ